MLPWLRRLRARMSGRRAEAELAEELRYHLEREEAALGAQGLGADEARQAARREALKRFGNPTLTAERCRDQRHLGWVEDATDDLRRAGRNLRHAPGFAVAAVVLLALGIGAVVALFGPLYSLVLSPLPFPQANQLVAVSGIPIPYGFVAPRLRRALDPVFTNIAKFKWGRGLSPVPGAGRPGQIETVTQEFFSTLGVAPRLGRNFRASDHELDGVIVSNAIWRARLHANPDLAGASIQIHGEPFRVLGVMPPGFDFPAGVQIWMLQPKGVGLSLGAPTIARLRPGLSLAAARIRLKTVARAQRFEPGRVSLEPLHNYLLGNRRPLLWMLWAVALLFLLLACAGVANLILARGVRRRPEVALRLALGAGRARLVRQLLAEAVLLACGGGALGRNGRNLPRPTPSALSGGHHGRRTCPPSSGPATPSRNRLLLKLPSRCLVVIGAHRRPSPHAYSAPGPGLPAPIRLCLCAVTTAGQAMETAPPGGNSGWFPQGRSRAALWPATRVDSARGRGPGDAIWDHPRAAA